MVYVIKHILSKPSSGILVIPRWVTATFWNKITVDGSHLLPMFINYHIFKPFITKGQECENMFEGYLRSPMLGLVFDSGVTEYRGSWDSYYIEN